MKPRFPVVLGLIGALALSPAATAVTIVDSFEAGPFTVSDVSDGLIFTLDEQSGLSTGDVVGGTRLVRVFARGTSGAIGATASLTTTPGPDSVVLTTEVESDFYFIYDGIADGAPNARQGALNLDLTTDNRLQIELTGSAASLDVTIWDGNGSGTTDTVVPVVGVNEIALADLRIDLADVRTIRIRLRNVSEETTVAYVRAVPEPGTASLLAFGLLGLASARSRT